MYLSCYSKMAVKFAASVLNETKGKTLQTFGTTEPSEKAKYWQMLDQVFDCLNVRSLEKKIKRKISRIWNHILIKLPKNSPGWQISSFHILIHGKKILKASQVISRKMSDLKYLQTFHGIQIAVRSTVKAAKGFLQNGCICILTERFCQDPVEEYFGIQ